MLPNFGIMEIAIVLVIALIVFGPKRLPELGKSLGKGINEFRDGLQNIGQDDDDDDEEEEAEPAELTPPPTDAQHPLPGEEPEVTENTQAEAVDGEVVREQRD
ncbi:MAG: twin-arginine translocase TatA/TatE family subunit [Solirubrobacterales bacterium]|nr:twin-arginine translocase TatA/TatE family subunit [Solirubrobacterales bacterium]